MQKWSVLGRSIMFTWVYNVFNVQVDWCPQSRVNMVPMKFVSSLCEKNAGPVVRTGKLRFRETIQNSSSCMCLVMWCCPVVVSPMASFPCLWISSRPGWFIGWLRKAQPSALQMQYRTLDEAMRNMERSVSPRPQSSPFPV